MNCISCLSFYPKKPSMIAAGSFTGKILLYDFSRSEEQLMAKTLVEDYFHQNLITKISWWSFRPLGSPIIIIISCRWEQTEKYYCGKSLPSRSLKMRIHIESKHYSDTLLRAS